MSNANVTRLLVLITLTLALLAPTGLDLPTGGKRTGKVTISARKES